MDEIVMRPNELYAGMMPMRERHEYKIVQDNYAYMLEDAVNNLCRNGAWMPIGGLCIRNDGVFFQALTRTVMEPAYAPT